ncbi:hypothetical protein BSN82_06990 [Acinetobacter baylyi]|nr:hypothetical protein BSL88_12065 [Acinetobacter baylyi]MAK31267.1 hypothetical protein [Acinetobacter sp.]KAF2371368.1 hypothetical protein BSL67_16395 [Acinetobacter baylyi]KAF2378177.1 hypothetical protein BSN81_05070 [Acinetobacter baylyi]KAF2379594.1 hypothetical protein BSN83_14115 [Acinetobacter baylyi]
MVINSLKILFFIVMVLGCVYLLMWTFHGFPMPSHSSSAVSSSEYTIEMGVPPSCMVTHPKEYCS